MKATIPFDVSKSFGLNEGNFLFDNLGQGHIHQTYRVQSRLKKSDDFVLQRLNHHVFPDIPALMSNFKLVTEHIAEKNRDAGLPPEKYGLNLVKTMDGSDGVTDQEGYFWRMVRYIPENRVHEVVTEKEIARQGGLAFGKFQEYLLDLDGDKIQDTIPRFHDIDFRYGQFMDSVKEGRLNRQSKARKEMDFVETQIKSMYAILNAGKEGRIPIRIVHNDTKFNNLLFDQQNRVLCVLDLDTVMNGFVHYDFGDAIRTCANTAAEDESNTELIKFNLPLFKAFTDGYMDASAGFLNEEEVGLLPEAPRLFAFIMGLRFVTDFLNGDKYYKVLHESHNLQRAKAQFELVKRMDDSMDEIKSTIIHFYQKYLV